MDSRDVFYSLAAQLGSDDELVSIAYGLFERDRFNWMEKKAKETAVPVSEVAMSDWITSYVQTNAIERARQILNVKRSIAAQSSAILKMSDEVARIAPASQDFWIGVGSGVVANFMFALLLLVCVLIFVRDPSLIDIIKTLVTRH